MQWLLWIRCGKPWQLTMPPAPLPLGFLLAGPCAPPKDTNQLDLVISTCLILFSSLKCQNFWLCSSKSSCLPGKAISLVAVERDQRNAKHHNFSMFSILLQHKHKACTYLLPYFTEYGWADVEWHIEHIYSIYSLHIYIVSIYIHLLCSK